MWAAIIVFVLLCGYHYTDVHLPSKYKLNKAVGWNAYFCVAMKGAEFLIQGIILWFFVVVVIYLTMFIINIPHYLFGLYDKFSFADSFLNYELLGLDVRSIILFLLTILVCITKTYQASKDNQDYKKRINSFREIAINNSIEEILLESIDRNLLLLVTLKSRKVYIGMLNGTRYANFDTSTLVIIPFISGYRDKDTLTFHAQHNYAEYYLKNNITINSEPLSLYQFSHATPLDQIESLSLFNIDTYASFQQSLNEIDDFNNKPTPTHQ